MAGTEMQPGMQMTADERSALLVERCCCHSTVLQLCLQGQLSSKNTAASAAQATRAVPVDLCFFFL